MSNMFSLKRLSFAMSFLSLAVVAAAAEKTVKVGKVKAGFSSPFKSWVSVKWYSPLNEKDTSKRLIITPSSLKLRLEYEVKDNSRVTGYKLKASQSLNIYNFDSWQWKMGGTGNSHEDRNTKFKKYTHKGSFDTYPLLVVPSAVCRSFGRFEMIAEARSRNNKHIRDARVFYVAKSVPSSSPVPAAYRTAALRWAIGRYERAVTLKGLAATWRSFSKGSRTDFSNAFHDIIVSATGYISDTSPKEFSMSTGVDLLTGMADMLGEIAGAVGEVDSAGYMAYTMAKNSWAILKSSEGPLHSAMRQTYLKQAASTSSLDTTLDSLAKTYRDEATTCLMMLYQKGATPSDWESKLQTEFNKIKDAEVAVGNAKGAAFRKLNELQSQISRFGGMGPLSGLMGRPSQVRPKLDAYLKFVRDLLAADKKVISKSLNWN